MSELKPKLRSVRSRDLKTYEAMAAYLGNKWERPLPGRSTRLHRRDDNRIDVRYHWTDVVTAYSDGWYVLRNGGFHTLTTRSRICQYTPFWLWSHKGEWVFGNVVMTSEDKAEAVMHYFEGKREGFRNGMRIHRDRVTQS